MTSTSQFKAVIRYDEATYGTDAPLSVGHFRTLANNAMHMADQAGQVRTAWPQVASEEKDGVFVAEGDDWELIHRFGPWQATLDEKGNPYSLRVRVAMRRSSGTGTATIGLSYGAKDRSHTTIADVAGNSWKEFSTSATTAGWVGSIDRDLVDILKLSRDEVYVGSPTAIGAGSIREVTEVVECELTVWNKVSATGDASISALYAAEYYNPP